MTTSLAGSVTCKEWILTSITGFILRLRNSWQQVRKRPISGKWIWHDR